ncbi:MAG: hypothetical protein ACUVQ5_03785 [Candidatus Methanomethylicaceae archaeon]
MAEVLISTSPLEMYGVDKMKRFKPVAFFGLSILVISAYLPWVSFNIPALGTYTFSVPDLFRLIGISEQPSQAYSQLASLFGTSIYLAGLSLVLLVITVLFGTAGVAANQANVISGASGMLSCILWIAAVNLLKSEVVRQTGFLGSLYPLVEVGLGPAVLALAVFIFLLAFALKDR